MVLSVALPFKVPAHEHLNVDSFTVALCNTKALGKVQSIYIGHPSLIFTLK